MDGRAARLRRHDDPPGWSRADNPALSPPPRVASVIAMGIPTVWGGRASGNQKEPYLRGGTSMRRFVPLLLATALLAGPAAASAAPELSTTDQLKTRRYVA